MMVRGARIATLVTLWLVPLLIFVSAFSSDWVATWRPLGVPSMTPHFLDLQSIPAAIETLHKGGNPLDANPADPLHRSMNYPRVWLYIFSAAKITRGNVSTVALIFCALYLTCISFLIVQTRNAVDAVILLLASLSAAPLLAMERGNTDLFVFAVIFLACVVTNKHLKSGLFGVAALLKIFPIAAMVMDAIHRTKKERISAVLLTGVVLALILLQWHDLSLIRKGTPAYSARSYGVLSLEQEFLIDTFQWGFLIGLGWIVVLECWLAGALAITNAWRNPREADFFIQNSRFAEMFAIFGGTYVFTYAVGSNFDYRLILLLPTLPLVLEMARISRHRVWAIVYLTMAVLAENSIGFEQFGGTIAGHAATFTLFIMLLGMLTRLFMASLSAHDGSPQMLRRSSPAVHTAQNFHSLE
jgi:Glycosyltransferase family 87